MHEFDLIQQPRKPAQKQQRKANPVSGWIEVETDYFDLSDPLAIQALDGSEPGVMDQQAGERLLVELSRANRFSLNELATNREGRLSDRQRARLLLPLAMACIGGLLSGVAILLGVYFLVRWNLLSMPWWLWIFVVLGIVLLLAIVLACGIQATQLMQDWREERVVQIDGKVKRLAYRANDSSSATYQYVYNDLSDGFSYKVNKAAYRALAPDLRYRIYHTPRAHRLVSLEPLESGVLS